MMEMMKVVLMTMIHLIMADRSGWDAFALSGLAGYKRLMAQIGLMRQLVMVIM